MDLDGVRCDSNIMAISILRSLRVVYDYNLCGVMPFAFHVSILSLNLVSIVEA